MPEKTAPAEAEMVSIPRDVFNVLAETAAIVKGGPTAYHIGKIYSWAGVEPSEVDSSNPVFMGGYKSGARDNA